MFHLRLHRGELDSHRASDLDRTRGCADQPFGCVAGDRHALAQSAHHVDDVVADRTDQRTAAAQRAAVVDQRFPFFQFFVGERFGQAQHLCELAEQGVFLLVHAAQRFQLVDRGVLRIAAFGIEQACFGAQAAMHAAAEVARDRRVDDFLEDADAFVEGSTHTCTSFTCDGLHRSVSRCPAALADVRIPASR